MNENEVSDLINQIFPENYEYKILNYEKFEMGTDDVRFKSCSILLFGR